MSRPPYKPTDNDRKTVELMSASGIRQDEICLCIGGGIAVKTLRKHFRRELDTAAIIANTKVAGSLFKRAINGDTASAIWWTKARMKWSEQKNVDLASSDGTMSPKGEITIKASDKLKSYLDKITMYEK